MRHIIKIVDNRELASLFWMGALVIFVVAHKATRKDGFSLLRLLLSSKIVAPFLLMAAYAYGTISLAAHFDLWRKTFLSITLIWFATTAVVLFFNSNNAVAEPGYFKRTAVKSIGVPVLIEFLVNLYPFGLLLEILLAALVFVLVAVRTVWAAKRTASPRRSIAVLDLLVAGIVLLLFGRGGVLLVASWKSGGAADAFSRLLVPVVLTLTLLPFLYLIALYAAYDSAFSQMKVGSRASARPWRGEVALILKCNIRLRRVAGVNGGASSSMARARTVRDGMRAFEDGLAANRAAKERITADEERLRRFAGVDGVDEEGERLDQREFGATKAALRFLATCHMGHYQNGGGRYRADMLEIIGAAGFVRKGLPTESGIQMRVSVDGRKWWAWRTTVTGWVFGMAAAEEPPDQWEYEGPCPPAGPPPAGAGWRNVMTVPEGPTNW